MTTMTEKKKKKKTSYFTKEHENAIVEYSNTDDQKVRTELYINLIQPVLSEMVDKITYTYKFTSLPNIDPLKDECKIWLTTILDKYDPSKGSKAFSYFSVVTKHWFIHKVKKNSAKTKKEVSYETMIEKGSRDLKQASTDEDTYESKRLEAEFWFHLLETMNAWDTGNLKPNEKKVLDACRTLFDNVDNIEIFNKKAIYLYLRELTGMNTKQVVSNLNRLRDKYATFKNKWNRGEI